MRCNMDRKLSDMACCTMPFLFAFHSDDYDTYSPVLRTRYDALNSKMIQMEPQKFFGCASRFEPPYFCLPSVLNLTTPFPTNPLD